MPTRDIMKNIAALLQRIEAGHYVPKELEMINFEEWLREQEEEERRRQERRREEEAARPTFGSYCRLSASDFPLAEELKQQEMQMLIDAFNRMASSWNYILQLPSELPNHLKYKLTIKFLNEKTPLLEGDGFLVLDHCCCTPLECIYKEYCHCLNYR
jgi:hypothetical protein